jgi:hypothetical protein
MRQDREGSDVDQNTSTQVPRVVKEVLKGVYL